MDMRSTFVVMVIVCGSIGAWARAPGVSAPGYGNVVKVALEDKLERPLAHHPGLPAGDGVYLSVITHGSDLGQASLLALKNDKKRWRRAWRFALHGPRDTIGERAEGTKEKKYLSSCNAQEEKDKQERPKAYLYLKSSDRYKLEKRTSRSKRFQSAGHANPRREARP
jgi:hypothetical protein